MSILNTINIKRVIIHGHLLILLSAFLSILWHVHGLFGERGLVPVAPMLECEKKYLWECRLPLLRFVCSVLELSPGVGLQFLALSGILIIFLAFTKVIRPNIITFLLLYFLYRTIHEAGGVFTYFDGSFFLLESTVFVGILAWFDDGPADSVAMYGIIVLLVRVTFMNGVTKLLSKSPGWWNLTAMDYHFQMQPLPTFFAWFAHHLPKITRQIITLITLYGEIVLPPFFLIPLIHLRYAMFFSQVLLVTLTVLTSNAGFFGYNIFVLLISLLAKPQISIGSSLLSVVAFSKIGYDIFYRFSWKQTLVDGTPVLSLDITHDNFQDFLLSYINFIVVLVPTMFLIVLVFAVHGFWQWRNKFRKLIHLGFVIVTTSVLLCYGMIPLARLDKNLAEITIKDPSIMHYYKVAKSWSILNAYGSYKQTDGSHGKPEIVMEGSHNIEGPWKEIIFSAKPGKVWTPLKFKALHQPLLDWQMHLAAEGTYQQNPFFLSLVYHLMQNTTEVVNLIEHYPFQNRSEPMKFVRANLYMYHFTQIGDTNWWTRDFQEEYMPAFNKGNPALLTYLEEHKLVTKKKTTFTNGQFGKFLKRSRYLSSSLNEYIFVCTFICVALLIKVFKNLI